MTIEHNQPIKFHDIFVGSETGLLKGVNIEKKQWSNINEIETASKESEICLMCWESSHENQICVGLRNQRVKSYNLDSGEWGEGFDFSTGTGTLKGLAKYGEEFVTAADTGVVKVWSADGTEQAEICTGAGLSFMTQNSASPHLICTGGKENDLKLWDLNKPEHPFFKAKNVRNDWLNLHVPVCVLGAEFLPDSQKVVTCTAYHQIRVYDPSSNQRRPVIDVEFDDYPITAMGLVHNKHQVVVGNSQGSMALVDLRKGKMLHRYKGLAGGVRYIRCHPTRPLVASCGLDRHLRVHDIDNKHLQHKFYLKSRLNCILMSTTWDTGIPLSEDKATAQNEEVLEEGDDEDMWNVMGVVETKTVNKSKTSGEKDMSKKRNIFDAKEAIVKKKKMKIFKK